VPLYLIILHLKSMLADAIMIFLEADNKSLSVYPHIFNVYPQNSAVSADP
jgi:hypothetical protein